MNREPIDIYNNGDMHRDFTFVEDLVRAIRLLIDVVPEQGKPVNATDSLSHVAPHRIVNIGNSQSVNLMDFIEAIETKIGLKAIPTICQCKLAMYLQLGLTQDFYKA